METATSFIMREASQSCAAVFKPGPASAHHHLPAVFTASRLETKEDRVCGSDALP